MEGEQSIPVIHILWWMKILVSENILYHNTKFYQYNWEQIPTGIAKKVRNMK
jgi:hypothetical protein